ncbi:hypothetical protein [Necropsobacter rosorum]|uniref:hypothetical protein n=1 Tax=Necropsobacter rosorum TaxID=908285 RepID=UPI0005097DA4
MKTLQPIYPDITQVEKAIKEIEFFLSFAKDYVHNGHERGAYHALSAIKYSVINHIEPAINQRGAHELQ